MLLLKGVSERKISTFFRKIFVDGLPGECVELSMSVSTEK